MFQPLPLFIGLRYSGARAHRFFVSFITWVSLLGVAVGVAALIVILSVMNGFETELRSRLLALSAPVRLSAPDEPARDWQALAPIVAKVAGVKAAEPYAELQVLAVRQPEMLPLQLRAAGAAMREELATLLVEGKVSGLDAPDAIIVGRQVAEQLAVAVDRGCGVGLVNTIDLVACHVAGDPAVGDAKTGDHCIGLCRNLLEFGGRQHAGAGHRPFDDISCHVNSSFVRLQVKPCSPAV